MSPPLSILLCALGGEGGGVLAEWLYAAAVRAGHAAQATSIPGVAQRTGATTYYVEIDPRPGSADSAAAVFSLNPVPGALDLLVSSELLETTRQVAAGLASPGRTQVISATTRALTVAEKMAPADGRLDEAVLRAAVQAQARQVDWLDLQALAQASGSAISAVMFGAISGSGALPWPRQVCEDTIRAGGKGVESSLRGFVRAFDAAAALRAQRDQGQALLALALRDAGPAAAASQAPAAPSAVDHDWAVLGRARVAGYQDEAYARLYDQRLARLDNRGAVRHEAARWLALWMCFDDIVAVAARKLAAPRIARVRREVGARDDEVLRVYDHFKPGVPELAGLLPAAAARRLQAWDARRRAAGSEPWAWPLRLGSHTVHGALMLW
ncbi:MAG: indolepyruvate oxidoreductase subunit beta family protein, partial [Aquabacterium sp.]